MVPQFPCVNVVDGKLPTAKFPDPVFGIFRAKFLKIEMADVQAGDLASQHSGIRDIGKEIPFDNLSWNDRLYTLLFHLPDQAGGIITVDAVLLLLLSKSLGIKMGYDGDPGDVRLRIPDISGSYQVDR